MRAALLMDPHLVDFVFGEEERRALTEVFDIGFTAVNAVHDLAEPERVEVLLMGWGAVAPTDADLDRLSRLRAIVHWGGGFGSAGDVAARGIALSSAKAANAVPVAEFTLAMITLAAKDVFWASRQYTLEQRYIDREREYGHTGLAGATVGVVGASTIGELVIAGLHDQGVDVAVHDPTLSAARAIALGVERVDDLEALAARSRILTIHAPDLPQTRGMVSAAVLAALPDGATLVNTARGALVDQESLVAELGSGRIHAVLDVTEPDPLPPGHPLYALPNVFLTPHLAGSMGTELRRLGAVSASEAVRFANGDALLHPILI
ncbi:hydroxyacid dehydrogenase [Microbacterium gilvum]|uniref:Hydroxyacid dehydrogenase n=1 Tax=Microbacterium gilvum TaxID=1336204 RepID=A0ABP9A8D4_9MICO